MAKLTVVPTPIGNLEDITLRALSNFKTCDFIYAEDTRVTKKLLNHFEIQKSIFPFHAHNEHKILDSAISHIKSAQNVVLVSDAGTPGISDPGFLLIRACLENEIEVSCLPGPCAIIPALVGSGFPTDRFCFEGFLPHKKGRQSKILEIGNEERTTVLYESPHRLNKCLQQINDLLGPDKEICVVREISKIYEEFKKGKVSDVLAHYTEKPAKGEIVVIIKGSESGKNKE